MNESADDLAWTYRYVAVEIDSVCFTVFQELGGVDYTAVGAYYTLADKHKLSSKDIVLQHGDGSFSWRSEDMRNRRAYDRFFSEAGYLQKANWVYDKLLSNSTGY